MEIEGYEDHCVRELQCVEVAVWAGFGARGCGLGGL